jgi:hypothetical protein
LTGGAGTSPSAADVAELPTDAPDDHRLEEPLHASLPPGSPVASGSPGLRGSRQQDPLLLRAGLRPRPGVEVRWTPRSRPETGGTSPTSS